jgi:hypothetical protein
VRKKKLVLLNINLQMKQVFDFKSKPKTTNFADNNPFDKNGQRIKKLEEFAASIITQMRDENLSYYDAVIVVQGVLTGLAAGIIAEKLMNKEEVLKWVEETQWETFRLIQKST